MSFGEVALCFFRLLLLIDLFGCLEHLICEILESVTIPSLVLSLGVKYIDAIQEAFKFTRPGSILLVASWPLHIVDRIIHLPLVVVAFGGARLVHVALLLLLLLLFGVEGRFLGQGIFVGDSQHLL
jgi:hypothetical protein